MEEKRIIEVGGVKMEVDMRYARAIDTFRIGEKVKVLIKEYSDSYVTYPGVIIGFDNFKERPCIVIAYTKVGYSDTDIKFAYLTKDSKDLEIVPMINDELHFAKEEVIEGFDRRIKKLKQEVDELETKKAYFLNKFGNYFIDKDGNKLEDERI